MVQGLLYSPYKEKPSELSIGQEDKSCTKSCERKLGRNTDFNKLKLVLSVSSTMHNCPFGK